MRGGRRLLEDTGGATYVEFLIAFLPVFIMFLGMIQAALMYSANLVVTHAANRAVRAAVVVLPDDPDEYGGERVNDLADGSSGGGGDRAFLDFLSGRGIAGAVGGAFGGSSSSDSERLSAIRTAGSRPLLAVSPSYDQVMADENILRAVGGNPAMRAAYGTAYYNRFAVAVTFPERPGSDRFKERFGPNEDITVRVTYLFHCGVPIAKRWMCDDYLSLNSRLALFQTSELGMRVAAGDASASDISAMRARIEHARDRLRRAQAGLDELDQAESPSLGYFTYLTGARFSVLRAEATMRNQGAPYTYR